MSALKIIAHNCSTKKSL